MDLISWADRWLQKLQCTATLGNQARRYPKRQGQQGARGVADGGAEKHGDPERAEDSLGHVADRGAARYGWIAFRKIAQDDAADVSEFTGVLQVQQHAVHLIGLHG